MPNWTTSQLEAIETRDTHLLVSAAAGAGKTAVLVERVCHYLVDLDGDIRKLLVVTFTEAAAAEMRQRIAAALRQRLSIKPGDAHLTRQLALLDTALISTIHAFCLWLLRRFFYRIDLDPGFRVTDEEEDRLLKIEVLDQLMEAHYERESAGSPFYDLVDCYGDQDDKSLRVLILALYDFAQSQVFPEAWLDHCVERFCICEDDVLEELPWFPAVQCRALDDLENARAMLAAALTLTSTPEGPEHYRPVLEDHLVTVGDLQRVVKRGAWDEVYRECRNLRWAAARGRASTEVDPALLERVKNLRDHAKRLTQGLATTIYTRPAAEMVTDLRRLERPVKTLVSVVSEFGCRYGEAKRARALVNFSDLERLTLRLLLAPESTESCYVPTTTALELRSHFAEVLCDEYQDINPVQDALLRMVTAAGLGQEPLTEPGPSTFFVGDVKQSIYRFRLAEPRIFLDRAQQAASGNGYKRIDLASNFRCRRAIVDGVNRLFAALMSEGVGDVTYDEHAHLVYGACYPPLPTEQCAGDEGSANEDPPIEILLLEGDARLLEDAWRGGATGTGSSSTSSEEGNDEGEDLGSDDRVAGLTSSEREALVIARRIRQLVEPAEGQPPFLVWDKKAEQYRPIRYRDIVVLLRSVQFRSAAFLDIFQQEGVPLYTETGTGYFQAPEVEVVLSLLSLIDNPRQDIPLAGVLHSSIGGLGPGELAQVRAALPEGALYDALAARSDAEDALGQRLSSFLERLNEWRTRARRGSLSELIWLIYRQTGFYDYVGGLPGGGQRQANLRALYDRSRQFDQFARTGLLRFLGFIDDLQAAEQDLGAAPALGENEDVVRLMSIHKSKGLEFPVVFVAGLGTAFNDQDLRGKILYDRDLGLGPQTVDPVRHTRSHTLASLGVREEIRRAGLSEEMRVLYVALTRARERLFLVATVRDVVATAERWRAGAVHICLDGRLPVYQATAAQRLADWLGPVLAAQGLLPVLRGQESNEVRCTVSGWQAVIFPPAALVSYIGLSEAQETPPALVEIDARTEESPVLSTEVLHRLEEQLSWSYPFAAASQVPAKMTVTELKRREAQEADPDSPSTAPFWSAAFRRPSFLRSGPGLTPVEVGTATHLVLQHIPLQDGVTSETVAKCVSDLVNREMLTVEEAAAIDQAAIHSFFIGPLGLRLQAAAGTAAGRVLREVPFCLAVPVEGDGGDKVLLQGVVDCLFTSTEGWVLVDFKTDRLRTGSTPLETVIRQRYATQLHWYSRAVRQILGLEVRECYVYLLAHGMAVPLPTEGAFDLSPNQMTK